MNHDRLVVYGCSLTAGTELIDYKYYNGSEKDLDERKKVDTNYLNLRFLFNEEIANKILQEQKNHSYAAYIAKNLNLTLVNNGVSAASNDYMIYEYQKDVAAGRITNRDLVLFGLTSPSRWFYIDNDGIPRRPIAGFANTDWGSLKLYKQFMSSCSNDSNILYQYLRSIKYIDYIHHNNKNVVAAYIHSSLDDQVKWMGEGISPDVISIYKNQRNYDCIIDHTYSFNEITNWSSLEHVHGGMHPREFLHRQLADHLSNKIQEKIK
jgi:hypothetical protein